MIARRPSKQFNYKDFGPCPKCLSWMMKTSLVKHQKTCPGLRATGEKTYSRKRDVYFQSDLLLGKVYAHGSKLLKSEVFPIMRLDEVGNEAQKDLLIVALGETWFRNCEDNELRRKYYSSQHMRLMTKLLLAARKRVDPSQSSDLGKGKMWDFLRLAYFEILVQSALDTAFPQMDDEEQLRSPSNVIHLKYDLIRVAETKRLLAGIELDKDRSAKKWKNYKEEASEFIDAVKSKWSEKVTRRARKLLAERKLNRVQYLPKPEDIQTLSSYLKEKLSCLDLDTENPSWTSYHEVVELLEARLVSYNRRRSGEVEAIKLTSYEKRKGTADVDTALMGDLSDTEKYLLRTQDLLETRGKKGRPVPVLIPQDCAKALEYIADKTVREKVGVHSGSKWLFASRTKGVVAVYRSLCNS